MKQLSLFPTITATKAVELTIQSINTYAEKYNHWQISFSGGKDSTTLVTLILDLIKNQQIPQPQTLTVMYADTRLELPPLQASALQILGEVQRRGYTSQIVMAPLDKRFWVYLLGRGVPPPNNSTLRWCTQQIKLTPMKQAMQRLYQQIGEKILSFNGVRIGESAMRDRRIAVSCSKNGSECGQGWFQRDLPDALCDKLSPLLHWRVCNIWDWLMLDAPEKGFDTEILAEVYGGDEAIEKNARTGCIGCPLASQDLALINLIEKYPKWLYLKPLLEIRQWHEWARKFENRHQKTGEKKKNGAYSAAPCRKGPLTLKAREKLLAEILAIQSRCNALRPEKMPAIDIINQEEENRIRELIALKTFPNKWTGDEPIGNELIDQIYSDGSKLPALPLTF